jgi:hypothetical protein
LGSPAYVSCDPGANVPVGFGSLSQSFTMPPTTGMRLVLDLSYHIYTFDRNMQLTDDWDRFDVLFNGNVVKKDMNQDKDQKPPRCDTPYNLGSTTVSIPVTGSPGANIVVTFRLYNRPDRFYNTYVYVDNVHLRFE